MAIVIMIGVGGGVQEEEEYVTPQNPKSRRVRYALYTSLCQTFATPKRNVPSETSETSTSASASGAVGLFLCIVC